MPRGREYIPHDHFTEDLRSERGAVVRVLAPGRLCCRQAAVGPVRVTDGWLCCRKLTRS